MSVLTPVNRKGRAMEPYVSKLLVLVAVIVFVLAAFGVNLASLTPVELVAVGLAFLGASFLVP